MNDMEERLLSDEEIEEFVKKGDYEPVFKEISKSPPFGPLITEIAKIYMKYGEDPREALEMALELVYNWVSKILYKELKTNIGDFLFDYFRYFASWLQRKDIVREVDEIKRIEIIGTMLDEEE